MKQDIRTLLARANAQLQRGDAAGAIAMLEEAGRTQPDDPRVLLLMALARERAGQAEAAEACLRRIRAMGPLQPRETAELNIHLSRVLRRLGRWDDAIAVMEEAVRAQPGSPRMMRNLADALHAAGRAGDALAWFEKAESAGPGDWQTLNNMALALLTLERPRAAETRLRRALEINPDATMCLNNLGEALLRQFEPGQALECFDRAGALDPRSPVPTVGRARALAAQAHFEQADEAAAALPRGFPFPGVEEAYVAYQLQRLAACDWRDHDDALARIRELSRTALAQGRRPPLKPLAALEHFPGDTELTVAVARAWSDSVREQVGPSDPPDPPGNARPRIACISPDFRMHPVAFLVRDLVRHLDRKRFEIVAVALAPTDDSELARDIREGADEFLDLSAASDEDAAATLRSRDFDLLLDLAGYTADARPAVLARRPGGLQVSYLGFFGSQQADWMDYLIASETLVPAADAGNYSESVIRLEPTPFPTDGFGNVARVNRAAEELPDDALVLSCFHRGRKLSPALFDAWMRILSETRDTVLWLRADSALQRRFLGERVAEQGLTDRVLFAGHRPFPDHIARQGLADLALDVWGFGGFNTNAIALWCGVPVLSLPGPGFASRVGAMALEAAGLGELIAADTEAYVRQAVSLCSDREALNDLQQRVKAAADSPLFDGAAATRRVEEALARVIEHHRSGAAPAAIRIEH